MPAAQARRLCPHAVFVRSRMSLYASVSRQIHRIFARYTPLVEPLALDEAFLDVTASERLFGDGTAIARRIKDDVRNELDLVASVGVGRRHDGGVRCNSHRFPDSALLANARNPRQVAGATREGSQ